MQVTINVSDEVVREAANQGLNVAQYVESLIAQGPKAEGTQALSSAIDRIRRLHAAVSSDGTHGSH
jgi:hypothetical protein